MSGIVTADWLAIERARIIVANDAITQKVVMQYVIDHNEIAAQEVTFSDAVNVNWIWRHKADLEQAGYTVEKRADKATLKW